MKPVKVVNLNKKGEVFNPAEYTVRREDHPEFYKLLAETAFRLREKEETA